MNIAKSIRVGLAYKGLSAQDMAKHLSKTPQAISYWMNSKADPRLPDIEKMAELFGVSVSVFISWGE